MKINISNKKKIALVLGGGGIKAAAFHVGVCLALKEKGFHFAGGSKTQIKSQKPQPQTQANKQTPPEKSLGQIELYVGSSAGAFIASLLASGYSIESLINAFDLGSGQKPRYEAHELARLKPLRYSDVFRISGRSLLNTLNIPFTDGKTLNLSSFFSLGGLETLIKKGFKLNGFFSTKGLESYLRTHALINNDFSQLNVELYLIGTHLNRSQKVIFGHFPEVPHKNSHHYISYAKISEAVAASTSLPPVYSPYKMINPDKEEVYFYDGEIRETQSTHVAVDFGADLIINSYSLQPYHLNKEIGSLHKYGIPIVINQALYQCVQEKIEKYFRHHHDIKAIYKTIDGYFKQNNLPEEHREKILEVIRKKMNYNPQVDFINIHPRSQNHEFFFADHFSLNEKTLEAIVKDGFRSAINTLRFYNL